MFNITTGNIRDGVLYLVYGTQIVIYNGSTYSSGQTFRGAQSNINFTFSGTGTQLVYEVLELRGSSIIYDENSIDLPNFTDATLLSGVAIEYMQNANDIVFNDITALNGFVIELLDYPFFSFQISETIF